MTQPQKSHYVICLILLVKQVIKDSQKLKE